MHHPHYANITARWYKHIPPAAESSLSSDDTHIFEMHVVPHTPLSCNDKIKIVCTSRSKYHTPSASETLLDVYDPHVAGEIIGVLGEKSGLVALDVKNECPTNPIRRAILLVPKADGVTTTAQLTSSLPIPVETRPIELVPAVKTLHDPEARPCEGSACNHIMYYEDPATYFDMAVARNAQRREENRRERRTLESTRSGDAAKGARGARDSANEARDSTREARAGARRASGGNRIAHGTRKVAHGTRGVPGRRTDGTREP